MWQPQVPEMDVLLNPKKSFFQFISVSWRAAPAAAVMISCSNCPLIRRSRLRLWMMTTKAKMLMSPLDQTDKENQDKIATDLSVESNAVISYLDFVLCIS